MISYVPVCELLLFPTQYSFLATVFTELASSLYDADIMPINLSRQIQFLELRLNRIYSSLPALCIEKFRKYRLHSAIPTTASLFTKPSNTYHWLINLNKSYYFFLILFWWKPLHNGDLLLNTLCKLFQTTLLPTLNSLNVFIFSTTATKIAKPTSYFAKRNQELFLKSEDNLNFMTLLYYSLLVVKLWRSALGYWLRTTCNILQKIQTFPLLIEICCNFANQGNLW